MALQRSRDLFRLETLPLDLLIAVLKPLDTRDRLQAGAACKALHSSVRRASALWEEVEFSGDLGQEQTAPRVEGFLAWLLTKAAAVRTLTLRLPRAEDPALLAEATGRVWAHTFGAILGCREGLERLVLEWGGCLTIGGWLSSFPHLSFVELRVKKLELGPGLDNLPSLKQLRARALAPDIASLPTSLTSLTLNNCGLRSLPACLSTLQRLEFLDLESNNLQRADFGALAALSSLRSLRLCVCNLHTLPQEVGALTCLTYLELSNTGLRNADLSALSSLVQLELLDVGGCSLQAPPPVAQLTALRRLSAWNNDLRAWPAGPWVGRLEMLWLDLDALISWGDALRGAQQLQRLFIARQDGDSVLELGAQHFAALFDALCALPALVEVGYVFDRDPSLSESPDFMSLLLQLSMQPHLKVGLIGWDNMYEEVIRR